MKLTIRKHLGTDGDVKLVRAAVPFMLKRLLKAEQIELLSLHIVFTHLRHDYGDIELECAPSFRLRLHHELDSLLMLVTLAHELIHLSQIVEKRLELKQIKDLTVWHWDGKPYGSEPYSDPDRVLPWESHANRHESDLACQFFKNYVRNLNAG